MKRKGGRIDVFFCRLMKHVCFSFQFNEKHLPKISKKLRRKIFWDVFGCFPRFVEISGGHSPDGWWNPVGLVGRWWQPFKPSWTWPMSASLSSLTRLGFFLHQRVGDDFDEKTRSLGGKMLENKMKIEDGIWNIIYGKLTLENVSFWIFYPFQHVRKYFHQCVYMALKCYRWTTWADGSLKPTTRARILGVAPGILRPTSSRWSKHLKFYTTK